MTDEVRRDAKGRFPPKQSGNRRGRPAKRKIDPKLPAGRRDVIMRVADRLVDVKVDGKGTTQRMSLYEANVFQLAISGAAGNRVAAQKFIDLAVATSEQDLARRVQSRLLVERMNQVEEELYQLQKKTGQHSPVVTLSPEEWKQWEAQNARRYDDRSARDLLADRQADASDPDD